MKATISFIREVKNRLEKAGLPQTTYAGRFFLNTIISSSWFSLAFFAMAGFILLIEGNGPGRLLPWNWEIKGVLLIVLCGLLVGMMMAYHTAEDD